MHWPAGYKLGLVQVIDDRYELLEVIASGGMASVWRARDTRLDRLVALKRPHPAAPGDDSAVRMAREARAAASLTHPNLITVYDYGSDELGPYLVMELVDGPTLLELVGEIEASEAVIVGAQVADALDAIHAAGIVHRDVKPGNVIMSERGPLLTDFGIAWDPNATSKITDPGKVVGTPSYAAPEVLAGETPTTASDVYSLAVMIDELVGGSGHEPGPGMETALSPALSPSPEDRPDAAALGAALRRVAPTMTGMSPNGSTLVMEATPPGPGIVGDGDVGRRRVAGRLWVAGLLAAAAVALVAIGLALSNGDVPADAAAGPTETSLAATTSTRATTSTQASTTTLLVETSVAGARNELESILLQPPRSDLKPSEVEDMMKKVDEAIEAAADGDEDKAEKKLSETAKKLDDKLDGESLPEAQNLLARLAELLGVDFDSTGDGDDDD